MYLKMKSDLRSKFNRLPNSDIRSEALTTKATENSIWSLADVAEYMQDG